MTNGQCTIYQLAVSGYSVLLSDARAPGLTPGLSPSPCSVGVLLTDSKGDTTADGRGVPEQQRAAVPLPSSVITEGKVGRGAPGQQRAAVHTFRLLCSLTSEPFMFLHQTCLSALPCIRMTAINNLAQMVNFHASMHPSATFCTPSPPAPSESLVPDSESPSTGGRGCSMGGWQDLQLEQVPSQLGVRSRAVPRPSDPGVPLLIELEIHHV